MATRSAEEVAAILWDTARRLAMLSWAEVGAEKVARVRLARRSADWLMGTTSGGALVSGTLYSLEDGREVGRFEGRRFKHGGGGGWLSVYLPQ
jgi:hypothetical protein